MLQLLIEHKSRFTWPNNEASAAACFRGSLFWFCMRWIWNLNRDVKKQQMKNCVGKHKRAIWLHRKKKPATAGATGGDSRQLIHNCAAHNCIKCKIQHNLCCFQIEFFFSFSLSRSACGRLAGARVCRVVLWNVDDSRSSIHRLEAPPI